MSHEIIRFFNIAETPTQYVSRFAIFCGTIQVWQAPSFAQGILIEENDSRFQDVCLIGSAK
jgi:hypothetical protein